MNTKEREYEIGAISLKLRQNQLGQIEYLRRTRYCCKIYRHLELASIPLGVRTRFSRAPSGNACDDPDFTTTSEVLR
jgi:hypothetical protein